MKTSDVQMRGLFFPPHIWFWLLPKVETRNGEKRETEAIEPFSGQTRECCIFIDNLAFTIIFPQNCDIIKYIGFGHVTSGFMVAT